MKYSIKNFLSKCDQIRSFLRIWSRLLKESQWQTSFFIVHFGKHLIHAVPLTCVSVTCEVFQKNIYSFKTAHFKTANLACCKTTHSLKRVGFTFPYVDLATCESHKRFGNSNISPLAICFWIPRIFGFKGYLSIILFFSHSFSLYIYISWPWLSLFRGRGSVTVAFLGKFANIYLSTYLSIYLSIYLFIYLSTYLSI